MRGYLCTPKSGYGLIEGFRRERSFIGDFEKGGLKNPTKKPELFFLCERRRYPRRKFFE